MEGMRDALLTFFIYAGRAGGDPDHLHPFLYYLGKLAWVKSPEGMVWSELWILILSLAGFLLIFTRLKESNTARAVLVFPAFFGLLLFLAYSLIPYKTPWILVSFYHMLILIGAFGMVQIYRLIGMRWLRIAAVCIFGILTLFTGWQSWKTIGIHRSDPFNPFVYAHPTEDIFEISDTVHQLARNNPDGKDLFVEVIFKDHEYWPLPWYLRDLHAVGWWSSTDLSSPAAAVVLADPGAEPDLLRKWYEIPPPGERHLYVPLFDRTLEIRHGAEIRGYIRQDMRQ
jgi:predicted membrane-bound mannosyltransferase